MGNFVYFVFGGGFVGLLVVGYQFWRTVTQSQVRIEDLSNEVETLSEEVKTLQSESEAIKKIAIEVAEVLPHGYELDSGFKKRLNDPFQLDLQEARRLKLQRDAAEDQLEMIKQQLEIKAARLDEYLPHKGKNSN